MPVTRDRSSSVRSRRSSSAWVSRSSSAPIRRRGLSSCPSDGSWSARLRGSADAAGSPRTGRTSTARRSPSSASLPSVSCYEGFATPHDVLGQTLTKGEAQLAIIRTDEAASDRVRSVAILHKDPVVIDTTDEAKVADFGDLNSKVLGVIGPPNANDTLVATLRRHYRVSGQTRPLPPIAAEVSRAI